MYKYFPGKALQVTFHRFIIFYHRSFGLVKMLKIPPEVLDAIFGVVARIKTKDIKACTLTCKTFLPTARRHLFASIDFLGHGGYRDLSNDDRDAMTKQFNEFLDRTPEVMPSVRTF